MSSTRRARPGARFLLSQAAEARPPAQVGLPPLTQTRYINTISPEQEPIFPGDEELERRIRRLIRWNARRWSCARTASSPGSAATSRRTRRRHASTRSGSTSSSRAGRAAAGRPDLLPGPRRAGHLRRAFLEGRLTEEQLDHFRRETPPSEGLSSYPHPRLMPDFWEFPTVSMGLGPIDAIYQARFNRYLQNRGLARHLGQSRLGLPGRRRDRRARGAGRPPRRRRRGPRQPDLRRQLQPPAPRRPGPRQRQDHPGARGGLPRRRAGT